MSVCQDTITNFTFLKSQSSIFNLVMIYSSMNLLSSAMATLLMIYLLSVKELQLGSYAVTITVFESIELVAFFFRITFSVRLYRKWSIRSNLLFENSLALLMIISIFVWHNPIVLFTLLFFLLMRQPFPIQNQIPSSSSPLLKSDRTLSLVSFQPLSQRLYPWVQL